MRLCETLFIICTFFNLKIANQINSLESNINEQPWTVVQLQQLWKNLARRAKSRPRKVKELIGCEYDNIEESFITQLDLKVLNILDSFAASNSQTTNNHNNGFKESSETSNSGEVLDWDNAISVLKTERKRIRLIFYVLNYFDSLLQPTIYFLYNLPFRQLCWIHILNMLKQLYRNRILFSAKIIRS